MKISKIGRAGGLFEALGSPDRRPPDFPEPQAVKTLIFQRFGRFAPFLFVAETPSSITSATEGRTAGGIGRDFRGKNLPSYITLLKGGFHLRVKTTTCGTSQQCGVGKANFENFQNTLKRGACLKLWGRSRAKPAICMSDWWVLNVHRFRVNKPAVQHHHAKHTTKRRTRPILFNTF